MRSHILRFFAIITMLIVLLWAFFHNLGYTSYKVAFMICCCIIFIIFFILIYALIKFRKTQEKGVLLFHSHMASEIFWAAIPFIILMALAFPAAIQLAKPYTSDITTLDIKSSYHL